MYPYIGLDLSKINAHNAPSRSSRPHAQQLRLYHPNSHPLREHIGKLLACNGRNGSIQHLWCIMFGSIKLYNLEADLKTAMICSEAGMGHDHVQLLSCYPGSSELPKQVATFFVYSTFLTSSCLAVVGFSLSIL
jgi:hypothetical protein